MYNIKNCSCGSQPTKSGFYKKNKYGDISLICKKCEKFAGGEFGSTVEGTVDEWNNIVADMSPDIFWDMKMTEAKSILNSIYS